MTTRRSMTPVLTQCCDSTCQVAICTGTWHDEGYEDAGVTYNLGSTPFVSLVFPDGDSFVFQYSFYGYLGSPGPMDSLYTDTLYAYFESADPGVWSILTNQTTVFIPPEGATYELLVGWCPQCAGGITVDFRINTSSIISFTITNACDPHLNYLCEVVPACSPLTVCGNPMNTVNVLPVTVTDLGGGLYTLVISDLNATGLWSDRICNDSYNIPNGAAFNCASCVGDPVFSSYPYEEWRVMEGGNEWILPIAISGVETSVSYGLSGYGIVATLNFDYTVAPSSCADLNSLRAQSQVLLDNWVTQFGSGVMVPVTNSTTTSVDCYGFRNLSQAGGDSLDFSHVGLMIYEHCDTSPAPSNATNFFLGCGNGLAPGQSVDWVFQPPT